MILSTIAKMIVKDMVFVLILLLNTNVFAKEYLKFNLGVQTLESALKQINRAKYKYEIVEDEDGTEITIFNLGNTDEYIFKKKFLTFNKGEVLCRIMVKYESHSMYDFLKETLSEKYLKIKEFTMPDSPAKWQSADFIDNDIEIFLSRKQEDNNKPWWQIIKSDTVWITHLTYIDSKLCHHIFSKSLSDDY